MCCVEHEATMSFTKTTPEEFEGRNIRDFAQLFGGKDAATIFIRSATEQWQFMEDVTTDRVSLQSFLNMQDLAENVSPGTTWRQFAADQRDKKQAALV
jgi:hypothetical protein